MRVGLDFVLNQSAFIVLLLDTMCLFCPKHTYGSLFATKQVKAKFSFRCRFVTSLARSNVRVMNCTDQGLAKTALPRSGQRATKR